MIMLHNNVPQTQWFTTIYLLLPSLWVTWARPVIHQGLGAESKPLAPRVEGCVFVLCQCPALAAGSRLPSRAVSPPRPRGFL